MFGDFAEMTLI